MLKPLTHIAWGVLLVAACLFTRIHCCPECDTVKIVNDTVWVASPPVSVVDSAPAPVSVRPNSKKVGRHHTPSHPTDSTSDVVINVDRPCDSIRTYVHHAGDSTIDISVESEVEGVELMNTITFSHKHPVIHETKIVNHVSPRKIMVYGMGCARIGVAPDVGIGGGVFLRRFGIDYKYYPFSRSHEAGVGIRIW